MLKWIKKHPILLLCTLFLFTPAALNYSGFCMAEGRWLSDEEYIRAAAAHVQANGPSDEYMGDNGYGDVRGDRYKPYYDPEIYEATPEGAYIPRTKRNYVDNYRVEDFFSKYPHCCKVVGRDNKEIMLPDSSFSEKLYGYRAEVVEVISDMKVLEYGQLTILPNYKTYVAVENCGGSRQHADW